MLIVKKFGGTSVQDKERIYNVAKRCKEDYEKGNDIVVVLSAMGKQTDELIKLAKDINEDVPKREMDMLLTVGEQTSVALMSMALSKLNIPSISLNAFQVPIYTTNVYGNSRIKEIRTERIKEELSKGKIVIITGFQGIDEGDNYTTLGRGGSDTTAVALASVLKADLCQIYKDVEGVYTADPRIVPNAKKIDEITYDEMLEFASLGAGVLHNRAVELAKKNKIPLDVRSSLNEKEGTIVKEMADMEKMLVSGVTADSDIVYIAVKGITERKGAEYKLFDALGKKHINVDIIIQSLRDDEKIDISFTVHKDNEKETVEIIKQTFTEYEKIDVQKNMAKVSIVGSGMMTNAGAAAKMFEALHEQNIEIKMISTSEIRLSVLIDEENITKALVSVHDKFFI